MNDKIKWLREQLPGWVDSGILSADKARLIGQQFQDSVYAEPAALQSRPLVPLAIAATFMLGLAVALLFGSLGFKPEHLISGSIIAGLLLVLPTVVMVWILYSRRVPASLYFLREPCILMQSICSGIAIFVFHSITDGFQGGSLFVFETGSVSYFWVPMMLVVLLITRSYTLPSLLAIALLDLILVYIWNSNLPGYSSGIPEGYFSMSTAMTWAYIVAFSILVLRQIKSVGRSRPRLSVLYMWLALLVFSAALVYPLASVDKNVTLILSAFFYASLIGIGRRFFYQYAESFEFQYRYRPFEMMGLMGIFFSVLVLTALAADDVTEVGNIGLTAYLSVLPVHIYVLFTLLALVWLASLVMQLLHRDFSVMPVVLFPLLPLAVNVMIAPGVEAGLFYFLYVYYFILVLALWMVMTGISTCQHQILNTGLVMLMAVILPVLFSDNSEAGALLVYVPLFVLAAAALGVYLILQRKLLRTSGDSVTNSLLEYAHPNGRIDKAGDDGRTEDASTDSCTRDAGDISRTEDAGPDGLAEEADTDSRTEKADTDSRTEDAADNDRPEHVHSDGRVGDIGFAHSDSRTDEAGGDHRPDTAEADNQAEDPSR